MVIDENHEKLSDPHTTRHGDSLAYLGQKSQLHHVSKVNLKQWPKGSKILFFVVWLTKIPMGIINQLWR